MEAYYGWLGVILFITMLAGLVRVLVGPRPADRMSGAQLFGSTGVAVLLLLGESRGEDSLRNVALVFVLLTLVTLVAFVERTPPETDREAAE